MLVTTSHASFIRGGIYEAPANTITEALIRLRSNFLFIRNSIDGNLPSMVYEYRNGTLVNERRMFVFRKPHVIRYVSEVIAMVFTCMHVGRPRITFVGVDPLNCTAGILLKKFRRTRKVVYFTVDYTERRFSNTLLNRLYHSLDRWCAQNADAVWNVSTRIRAVRERMGIPVERNLLVPNVPSDAYRAYLSNERKRYHLVTLGVLGEQMDYRGMFDAVRLLRVTYPDIRLTVVGSGPKQESLMSYVRDHGLADIITFTGHLSHGEALEVISRSGVGMALYNGAWSFNHFGDSMKCREFFCFGLPVVTTDTHSTVDEIQQYGAGVVCSMGAQAYHDAIDSIFKDYDRYSRSATALAERYANIHERLLRPLLDSE